MLYPEPSTQRQVLAYVAAVPAAFAVACTLHHLLRALRQGRWLARFLARVWIIDVFYTTFAGVMVLIGGPYIFAGRRHGGWNTSPTTAEEILSIGLVAGVIGAVLWPVVTRAKGHELDM